MVRGGGVLGCPRHLNPPNEVALTSLLMPPPISISRNPLQYTVAALPLHRACLLSETVRGALHASAEDAPCPWSDRASGPPTRGKREGRGGSEGRGGRGGKWEPILGRDVSSCPYGFSRTPSRSHDKKL